ncbi:MAG: LCP family protein [Ruthenibacterium sp.]
MSQNTPRNINLNHARGAAQPASGTAKNSGAAADARRQVYDQAADAQRPYHGAAQGQVRRTVAQQPQMRRDSGDPYAAQQQQTRSAAQQRQAAAQQRSAATYEEYTIQRQTAQRQTMARQQQATAAQQRSADSRTAQQRSMAQPGAAPQRTASQGTRTRQPAHGMAQRSAGAQAGSRSAVTASRSRAAQAQAVQGRAPYRSEGVQGTASNGGNGGGRNSAAAKKRKQQKAINRALTVMCATFAVLLVCYIGLRVFASTIINTGEGGTTAKEYRTPPQFAKDQLNMLMLGIDYTAEDGQGRSPNGNTDMIMYVRFNFADNTIRMLQIPRDTFVGLDEMTGNTGKINALYANGADKENRVNNLANVLYEQYKLPVDNYVSIDMDSLRNIVDLFGGIDVYVTEEMQDPGTDSYIPAGMQHLSGAASEFFLRNRKQYATSDIRRLENQRYFYSALFRLVRTSPWQEIVKLVPVVQQYVNTDLDAMDCAALGIKLLKIPSSQIMICRLPVGGALERYHDLDTTVCAVPQTAELLNQYFRPLEAPVTEAELNIAQVPMSESIHEANVQWMSDIDANGGGTVGGVADATQTGDDVLAAASSAAQSAAGSATGNAAA